jgi:hypothetical protein
MFSKGLPLPPGTREAFPLSRRLLASRIPAAPLSPTPPAGPVIR